MTHIKIDITYFPQIRPIHTAYQNKKLSLTKRDKLLKPYRQQLYQIMVNDPHALPTRNIKNPPQPKMTHEKLNQLTADWYGVPMEDVE